MLHTASVSPAPTAPSHTAIKCVSSGGKLAAGADLKLLCGQEAERFVAARGCFFFCLFFLDIIKNGRKKH